MNVGNCTYKANVQKYFQSSQAFCSGNPVSGDLDLFGNNSKM